MQKYKNKIGSYVVSFFIIFYSSEALLRITGQRQAADREILLIIVMASQYLYIRVLDGAVEIPLFLKSLKTLFE